MLTKSGARLLDFGLAKPIVKAAAVESTRLEDPVTAKGSVVGTVPYMAPEQIEGREADSRTDLFAFGTLLHEMVTGARAFNAPSVASLMSAILRDDPPPPSRLVPGLPPALDHVVRRCLAKDPEDRWASAHDLLIRAHVDSRGRLRGKRCDASVAATVMARTRGLAAPRDVARGAGRVGPVAARFERRSPAALAVPAGSTAQHRVALLGLPQRLARRTACRHDSHGGRRTADAVGTAPGRGGIPEGGQGH